MSVCHTQTPGVIRVQSDFGTDFDASDSLFSVHESIRDMPPGKLYVVTLKNGSNKMIIWHDDDIFSELKFGFPVISKCAQKREIRSANDRIVGEDSWGYLTDGDQWRYVRFSVGDALGYQPVSAKQAALFDQVISSACISKNARDGAVQRPPLKEIERSSD